MTSMVEISKKRHLDTVTENMYQAFTSQLREGLDGAENDLGKYLFLRNLIMTHIVYYGGLTIPEVVGLNGSDVLFYEKFKPAKIMVRGETQREIDICNQDRIFQEYDDELFWFKDVVLVGTDREIPEYLLSRSKKRIKKREAINALSDGGISPESLRNGHVLSLLKREVPINDIAERLGIHEKNIIYMVGQFRKSGLL